MATALLMLVLVLVLVLGFHSVRNEIRGQSTSNKIQIACSQLRAYGCSPAIRLGLRCAPEKLKLRRKSKGRLPAMKPGYRSIKAGKVKINVKRHKTLMSWDAALRVCQSEGGSLIKIDTKEKEKEIVVKLKIKGAFFSPVNLWIGLRYFEVQRRFEWTDKTPLAYQNWGTGEPSHTWTGIDGVLLREDCGALTVTLMLGYHWNDRSCKKTSGFICEVL